MTWLMAAVLVTAAISAAVFAASRRVASNSRRHLKRAMELDRRASVRAGWAWSVLNLTASIDTCEMEQLADQLSQFTALDDTRAAGRKVREWAAALRAAREEIIYHQEEDGDDRAAADQRDGDSPGREDTGG